MPARSPRARSSSPVAADYALVFLVYNTLFNLLTQEDQVRCFAKIASHLTGDGAFVVEAIVPSFLHRLSHDQHVDAEAVGANEVWLDVGRHDPMGQTPEESNVRLTAEGDFLQPIVTRFGWPSELDLMARLAGLRLKERWGGWSGEPFTGESASHVSV